MYHEGIVQNNYEIKLDYYIIQVDLLLFPRTELLKLFCVIVLNFPLATCY